MKSTTLLAASVAVAAWTAASALAAPHHGSGTEKLGEVRFETSCNAAAQQHFTRAVALLHSFWFDEAGKAFAAAAGADPGCAMAHWGLAMNRLGNPLSGGPSARALADGWVAVQRAQSIGGGTERERGYIAAIATFYKDHDKVDHRTRALAYEAAMAKLAAAHPEDREATVFYALALNITALPTDKTYANQLEAGKLLEAVFAEQPNHPGVAHYLIHTYDYPPIAKEGLDAAKRYASIAPSAPHALHMPSHIFTRLGHWQESIDSNRASADVAKREAAAADPGAASIGALHAFDYMAYAHLQQAQDEDAKRLVDEVRSVSRVEYEYLGAAYAIAAIPARYALERHRWADAAALSVRQPGLSWDRFPQAEAVTHFARGLGAARGGDVAAAGQSVERLGALHAKLEAAQQGYWAGQVEIQGGIVMAWIAHAEGKKDEALRRMRDMAVREDATEKHIVSPGPIVPARELLGMMLLETVSPAEALRAFEASHKVEPNRFHGLAGAARAAELAGDRDQPKGFYRRLLAVAKEPQGARPELMRARELLASN